MWPRVPAQTRTGLQLRPQGKYETGKIYYNFYNISKTNNANKINQIFYY